ncbi:hypothetical protein [Microbacterium esteraromaticum]|uniref:hypothetical protein n=1 Tax=Microbacterium esteraromaticum TaxID=57043 RepID=UPI001956EEED|nr:hypothetical protein [Microbacterium esteraromaticum]MBM7464623.1 hypothetical protein [Microbacterium esteraromaticum]
MDETAVLAPGAHRVIRMLDRQESAYRGDLISDGERRGVRVDAETVPDALWAFAGAEHVAGVRDVVRRADGHDAVLPWCADQVEVFLGRRTAAEAGLSAGETVTLVGSMMRGIVEVADRSVSGRWWLTDEACPMFAPGEGAGCAEEAVAIITRLRESGTDRAMDRLLGEIAGAAGDWRVVLRSAERWENELTDLAAPRPLGRELPSAPAVAIEADRSWLLADVDAVAEQPHAVRLAWGRIAERASSAGRRILERLPGRGRVAALLARGRAQGTKSGRLRVILAGAAAAGAVLAGGLMWPSSDEDSAATERPVGDTSGQQSAHAGSGPTASPGVTPAGAATPDEAGSATDAVPGLHPSPSPDGLKDGSAEQQAVALLEAVAACEDARDAVCEDAVVDGSGALVQERLAGADASRPVTAVEDYGDVSVLRLGPSGERGEQMLVLVRQKDRWLVRDVYDVADQPSDAG